MYRKIMVPMDGSELAECVLPHVETVARGCGVETVFLVRVVEPFQFPSSEYVYPQEETDRIDSENKAAAENYLRQLVGRLKYNGVKLQAEVISGRAAESLIDFASKNEVDLIIMATHGRSGISRWVWGSVAGRVLRSAQAPILMVRAPGCEPAS